jgi:hypothetical protein
VRSGFVHLARVLRRGSNWCAFLSADLLQSCQNSAVRKNLPNAGENGERRAKHGQSRSNPRKVGAPLESGQLVLSNLLAGAGSPMVCMRLESGSTTASRTVLLGRTDAESKLEGGRRNNRPPVEHQNRHGEVRNPHGLTGKLAAISEIEQFLLEEAHRLPSFRPTAANNL